MTADGSAPRHRWVAAGAAGCLALAASFSATTPSAAAATPRGSAPTTAPTPASWLCDPNAASDDCRGDLTTTVDQPDGAHTVTTPATGARSPIDCFYVYPTASQQVAPNSTGAPEASVRAVARQQVQQFSSVCRVWAPLYRQRTMVALTLEKTFTKEQRAAFYRTAYADVLAAWREYRRHEQHGRGVVLIGHSQGSRLLRKLIREQVDPYRSVRKTVLSAILPGADVLVRVGSDRGGDFDHLPLCTSERQIGCVLAWSTFSSSPPSTSRFGRTPSDDDASPGLDLPYGPAYRVACTNPAALAGGSATASTLMRTELPPGLLGLFLIGVYGGLPPRASTPWLVPAERYSARCTTANGAHVLVVRAVGSARHLHPEPSADWGLHLLDINLFLGDLVRIVRSQVTTWLSRQHLHSQHTRARQARAKGRTS